MLKKIVKVFAGLIVIGLILLLIAIGVYYGKYSINTKDDIIALSSFITAGIFSLGLYKSTKG